MGFRLFTPTVAALVGVIGLQTPLLLFSSMAAIGQSTRTCTQVILDAQNRLETGRDLTVELRRDNLSRNYPDYPENHPDEYIWALRGSATSDVLASPQMMKAIAVEIINTCDSVGAVTFARDQSGQLGRYGLMPDGSIKGFKCAEDFGIELGRENNQKPQWGMQFCGL